MASQISGYVAKLITDDELVINKGSEDGVERGMLFHILDPSTESVTDPVTGEDLGGVSRVKATVEVIRVGPRVALARRKGGSNVAALGEVLSGSPRRSTLTGTRWIDGVERGDPVRSLRADERDRWRSAG